MIDKRYRAALIGLGRIADTIDDEVIGDGWLVPFSHMGQLHGRTRGAGGRCRRPIRRTT